MHEEYQISALDFATLSSPTPGPRLALSPAELMSLPRRAPAVRAPAPLGHAVEPLRRSRSGAVVPRGAVHRSLRSEGALRLLPRDQHSAIAATARSWRSTRRATAATTRTKPASRWIRSATSASTASARSIRPAAAIPVTPFYPGSLVWDQRCIDLRDQVCRSTPGTGESVAGSRERRAPADRRFAGVPERRARIVRGHRHRRRAHLHAEGWACDPDFPGASNPIQISVGGALGDAAATLYTTTADRPLAAGWRETANAACGEQGPTRVPVRAAGSAPGKRRLRLRHRPQRPGRALHAASRRQEDRPWRRRVAETARRDLDRLGRTVGVRQLHVPGDARTG